MTQEVSFLKPKTYEAKRKAQDLNGGLKLPELPDTSAPATTAPTVTPPTALSPSATAPTAPPASPFAPPAAAAAAACPERPASGREARAGCTAAWWAGACWTAPFRRGSEEAA
jgi:hypothetical protein